MTMRFLILLSIMCTLHSSRSEPDEALKEFAAMSIGNFQADGLSNIVDRVTISYVNTSSMTPPNNIALVFEEFKNNNRVRITWLRLAKQNNIIAVLPYNFTSDFFQSFPNFPSGNVHAVDSSDVNVYNDKCTRRFEKNGNIYQGTYPACTINSVTPPQGSATVECLRNTLSVPIGARILNFVFTKNLEGSERQYLPSALQPRNNPCPDISLTS